MSDTNILRAYEYNLDHTPDKLYIGGEWTKPIDGDLVETIDPSTGRAWALAPMGGAADIDRAVAAANEAFKGWSRTPGHVRAATIRRFAELFRAAIPELLHVDAKDTGALIRDLGPNFEAQVEYYHWFASLADKTQGSTLPIDDQMHAFTTKVPMGVVGAIVPWNMPMFLACLKIGPALAAGCTVVLKPAEQTPLSALILARLADEAGFPPGVFNVVPGYGNDAGARLVSHPDIAKISFTGEGRTATRMLHDGAESLKRFSFELGGKAPHIIFADAEFEQAINAATSASWRLTGQSCTLGSRVLVERSIYDRAVAEFSARAKRVKVGTPFDRTARMGPQANEAQLAKTLSYVDLAAAEGATLVSGGNRISTSDLSNGYFVEPTVFADVDNSMRVAQEEIFGPVASLIPFDDEDEAIAIANDTPFGLTAGLWTRDIGRAHRVSNAIDAGTVWVNTYLYLRWSGPYGGFKSSGWGREGGIDALDSFMETKTTYVSLSGQFTDPYAG